MTTGDAAQGGGARHGEAAPLLPGEVLRGEVLTGEVQVAGVGLWLPGVPSAAAFREGRREALPAPPRGHALNRVLRRRASLLDRALADVCAEAHADADVDPATVQTVIGSAYAELDTLLGLLDQIWCRREPVSPAAFAVSVHNAASGLISISSGNRAFTTSISADDDTPAAALLEAVGLVLSSGEPVVVACGDGASPSDLVPDEGCWELLAAAVVLAPAERQGGGRARMRIVRDRPATLPPAELGPALARNPTVGLLDLAVAVLRGARGTVRLDRGDGLGYGLGYGAELQPGDRP
jgi:hypothetical protein